MPDHSSAGRARRGPARPRRPGQTYHIRNQAVFVPDGYLAVGQIVGAHGLRGELKVEPYTDYAERFAPGSVLLMGEDLEEIFVAAVRPHKGHLLLEVEEFLDRTEAEAVRGEWLFVAESDAATLEADSYWIHDIIGLNVITETGQQLGQITDVLVTGANDVYIVQPAAGVNNGREILLPAIADVVLHVDLEAGTMTVHLPEGLVES